MPSERTPARGSLPRLRVVFMGTPDFAVPTLNRLLASQSLVGVFTQPDRPAGRGRVVAASPVKALAALHEVPVFQPRSFRKEPAAVDALGALEPDVVVVAAYGLILPKRVLDVPKHGTLNVHASLLPRWRGAAPVAHAILAGDTETGVTIMLVDEGLDTGAILTSERMPIGPAETAGELTARLAECGADLLARTLPEWMAGRIPAAAQDDALATYAPRLTREDGRLDWQLPAASLARRVRAMAPWPGAFALWDGAELKVHAATVVLGAEREDDGTAAGNGSGASDRLALAGHADSAPGCVIEVTRQPVVVTGDGFLRLDVIQAPGGKPMRGEEFVRGRRALIGARLG